MVILKILRSRSSKKIPEEWEPFMRDPEYLNRYWMSPGDKGFEHRNGGLEKKENLPEILLMNRSIMKK
jgi:hypothetical protein